MNKKSPDIKQFFHEELNAQLTALLVLPSLNLPQLNKIVIDIIAQAKEIQKANGKQERIGYVSGVISGQGDDKIRENLAILSAWVEDLQSRNDFPVFGPTNIFTSSIYKLLEEMKLPKDEREIQFDEFWASIVAEATDIYMTPRWETGRGTKVEHDKAMSMNKKLHFPKRKRRNLSSK